MSGKIRIGPGLVAYGNREVSWAFNPVTTPDTQPPLATALVNIMTSYDAFLLSLTNARWSIHGPLALFPLYADGRPATDLILSLPPDVSSPEAARYDEIFYGSTFHGISSLASILSIGRPPTLPSSSDENFCRHATFSGLSIYPVTNVVIPPVQVETFPMFPTSTGISSVSCLHYVSTTVSDGFNMSTHLPISRSTTNYRASLRDWVAQGATITFGSGTKFYRYVGHVVPINTSGFELRFRVDGQLNLANNGAGFSYTPCQFNWSYEFSCEIAEEFRTISGYPDGSVGSWKGIPYPQIRILSATCTDPSRPVTYSQNSLLMWHQNLAFRGTGITLAPNPEVNYGNRETPYTILNNFRYSVDQSWRDIVPSSLFSSVSAIQSISAGTTTDVLQTVAKLPEYKSMIPDLQEAIRLLGHLSKRDISPLTIKEIVDLASSTTLQASFQWRPLLQLLTKELPKIVASLGTLRRKGPVVVGRGDYSFNFVAGTFNRPASSIKTRSKIVLDLSERSLASSLLGADAFGILPKPSNLWDLVPFSFIANWITGVGGSLKRAEYSVLLSTIPAYYVHTYTLSTPYSGAELSMWSMSSSDSDALSARLFYRDVSLFSPLPRDSKFGFGIPTQLPPLGSVASLLWQVLT